MGSVESRQGTERGKPNYYLPLDFETTLLYALKSPKQAVFARMHHVPVNTDEIECLASIIDEDSPEFAEAAREIQKALEEQVERSDEGS